MNFNENGKGMTRVILPNKGCRKRERLDGVSHSGEYLAGEPDIFRSPRPPIFFSPLEDNEKLIILRND